LQELYESNEISTKDMDDVISAGKISEKDKFHAAKQILFGLAFLYVITIIAYLIRPVEGVKLIDICITSFPPLATLILVAYFRDKHH
jgi:hypothetical protein